nr:hypothetical protein [Tanacetum cinerariifolium]
MSNQATDPVTSKLLIAHRQSASAALGKEDVLRRIRYHKCLRKLDGTFESLVNKTVKDERWLEPLDAFTSP